MQSFCKVNFFANNAVTHNFAAFFNKPYLNNIMKKIVLALLMLCSFMSMYAQGEIEMTLHKIVTDNVGIHHKAPARLPSVSYDDSHVYVVAPFTIESATIIIYNEDGEVIYSTVTPITTEPTTVYLPQSVCDERYSLELVYGSMDLIGFF